MIRLLKGRTPTWPNRFSLRWKPKQTSPGLTKQTNQLIVKNTEKIVNSSKKVTNSPQTTSSSRTTTTSDSKSSTGSNSSSHQNKKEQKPKAQNRSLSQRQKRTLSRSTTDMDVLMMRRRSPYGIFLRMSRHQKRGDLQREDGGRVLNGRKAFPRSDTHNGCDHPMELSRSKG